jgi:hypothetical protein
MDQNWLRPPKVWAWRENSKDGALAHINMLGKRSGRWSKTHRDWVQYQEKEEGIQEPGLLKAKGERHSTEGTDWWWMMLVDQVMQGLRTFATVKNIGDFKYSFSCRMDCSGPKGDQKYCVHVLTTGHIFSENNSTGWGWRRWTGFGSGKTERTENWENKDV